MLVLALLKVAHLLMLSPRESVDSLQGQNLTAKQCVIATYSVVVGKFRDLHQPRCLP
jgi:hypothetical protein